MLNYKNVLIIVIIFVLFIALITEILLPSVTIAIKDATFICLFILTSYLFINLTYEKEKSMLEKKIFSQHAQLNTLINNLPICVLLEDLEGNILLANDYYTKKHNDLLGPVIGKNLSEIYKDINTVKEDNEKILKTKQPLFMERKIEFKKGNSCWFRLIKAPIFDENNNITSFAVLANDIETTIELEENKKTLVAMLTHDLKTPTIAQIRTLDLLLKKTFGELSPEQSEIISQIKDSCNYMYNLIYTILDSYLYDNGKIKINYENIDMLQIINSSINEIVYLLKEKNLNIVFTPENNILGIEGDLRQIKRVVMNLLSNAITYSDKNSDIIIKLSTNNDSLHFEITNKSQYIPQEQIDNIFDKYHTINPNNKFKKTGFGLGLYIVKLIITAHEGNVKAESDKSGLCTFSFSMPIKHIEKKEKLSLNLTDAE